MCTILLIIVFILLLLLIRSYKDPIIKILWIRKNKKTTEARVLNIKIDKHISGEMFLSCLYEMGFKEGELKVAEDKVIPFLHRRVLVLKLRAKREEFEEKEKLLIKSIQEITKGLP